jgi:hypothetical protein
MIAIAIKRERPIFFPKIKTIAFVDRRIAGSLNVNAYLWLNMDQVFLFLLLFIAINGPILTLSLYSYKWTKSYSISFSL